MEKSGHGCNIHTDRKFKIDRWIWEPSAVIRTQKQSVVIKTELSQKAKLSI